MLSGNAITICGPTASGKTTLAVRVARALGGEVLSADSRQVYRGMDIGTGKDLGEYGILGADDFIPYHLIDIVDPSQIYTLYDYQQEFHRAFNGVVGRGRLPVIVGGSGLYIEAVLKGYRLPEVPEDVEFRKSMMEETREALLAMLEKESPQILADTDISSKKRIIRALEIARANAGAVCERPPSPRIDSLVLYVVWERFALRARIEKRLHDRIREGLVDEVAGLLNSGIDRGRFALFGMEYKHVARYIDGIVGFDEMMSQLLQDIYHLAKRQDTWFRGMERRGMTVHPILRGDYETAMEVIRKNNLILSRA